MKIYEYIARRVLLLIPVIIGILTITFVISHVFPADPLAALLGPLQMRELRPETIEMYRKRFGLDLPLHEQFFNYMSRLVQGDLGESIRTRNPILEDLAYYFPATIELAMVAMLLSLAVGIPLGIISAVRKDKIVDHMSRLFSLAGVCMPSFWLALVLIIVFYYRLDWLPAAGRTSISTVLPPTVTGLATIDSLLAGDIDLFLEVVRHMILPSFVLAYRAIASIARMARSSMLEVMRADYIRTARSKGLSERIVIYRHALKNAMIPTVTISGLMFGSLLSGSVLVETVFSWPGLGWYATAALTNVDFPAVMAVTLVFTLVYSLANLIVDVTYGWLDPRIKY